METDKKNEFKKAYFANVKRRSERLMNKTLIAYFLVGILLGFRYNTVRDGLLVGGLTLVFYWLAKYLFSRSCWYKYTNGIALGVFTVLFNYQMHGMFEMHFFAFIGSVLMITYQDWKLQVPLFLFVLLQHLLFCYWHFTGFNDARFTESINIDMETFLIHIVLSTVIFVLSGLRAYSYRLSSEKFITQSYEIGRLQEKEIENAELLKVNQELDRFVYSVSHDLRAPLTGMLGVMMLAERESKDPQMSEYFRLLKGSVKRLDCFIADILDYSRNSRLEQRVEKVDFKLMLDDVTDNLRSVVGKVEGVKILANINDEHEFKSDRLRLSMVLNNLILNAVRYRKLGDEPSFVKVDITTNEKGADILVEDNGIGIKEEVQEKVFDMFYRGSDASVGSGLGLYIVKEALDKLNATIKLTSVLGKGTKFAIHLPTL